MSASLAGSSGAAGKPELSTLTLEHILSDLDVVPATSFLLSPHGAGRSSSRRTGAELVSAFEQDRLDASSQASERRAEYVELSRELAAGFRHANRLNTEQVSAGEVGLVLPSERSAQRSDTATPREQRSNADTSTRTDLLHAKVATLQTQVDAWHNALQIAVGHQQPSTPSRKDDQAAQDTAEAIGTQNHQTSAAKDATGANRAGEIDSGTGTTEAAGTDAHTSSQAAEFEDDDPWNDLS